MTIIRKVLPFKKINIEELDPNPPYWIMEMDAKADRLKSRLLVRADRGQLDGKYEALCLIKAQEKGRTVKGVHWIFRDDVGNLDWSSSRISQSEFFSNKEKTSIIYYFVSNKFNSDVFMNESKFFCSSDFRNLLHEFNFQYNSYNVEYTHVSPALDNKEYQVIVRDAFTRLDIVDRELSTLYTIKGQTDEEAEFYDIVFRTDIENCPPIFRLPNKASYWVTADFADATMEAGLQGIAFRHPSAIRVHLHDFVVKGKRGLRWHDPSYRKRFLAWRKQQGIE